MEFKKRTLMALADMICGNFKQEESAFPYRSSSVITRFFEDCDTSYAHDGTTRNYWVAETLSKILKEPQPNVNTPPDTFARVIRTLMDPSDALNEGPERGKALALLNNELAREGFEAFYGPDRQCYLRHVATNTLAMPSPNPHRRFQRSKLRNGKNSRHTSTARPKMSSSKKFYCLYSVSSVFTALQPPATKTRSLSTARMSG